ncbi:unnamed protein product [Moneuplotes crassus]|uniref:Uncharacterized protein n=1 Tax=Euplotes crassus TaxID=5936 RepID=A0AAD1XFQ7_EUPCR|nr:unnamed protein product [Moneuplotes crassus]
MREECRDFSECGLLDWPLWVLFITCSFDFSRSPFIEIPSPTVIPKQPRYVMKPGILSWPSMHPRICMLPTICGGKKFRIKTYPPTPTKPVNVPTKTSEYTK